MAAVARGVYELTGLRFATACHRPVKGVSSLLTQCGKIIQCLPARQIIGADSYSGPSPAARHQ